MDFWKKYIAPELIYGNLASSQHQPKATQTDHTYFSVCEPGATIVSSSVQPVVTRKGKGPLKRSKLPPVYLCGKCGDNVELEPKFEQDKSVECTNCRMRFHVRCTKLGNVSNVCDDDWICINCK